MGRIYISNNDPLDKFEVNVSGTNLLGLLHFACGIGVNVYYDDMPETLFEMDDQQAKDMAISIREFVSYSNFTLRIDGERDYDDCESYLWDGTREELRNWFLCWADWLENSGGYTVI